jgi:hypothetical protein
VFWVIASLGGLVAAAYLASSSIVSYFDREVIIDNYDTISEQGRMPQFPAVTVCPSFPARCSCALWYDELVLSNLKYTFPLINFMCPEAVTFHDKDTVFIGQTNLSNGTVIDYPNIPWYQNRVFSLDPHDQHSVWSRPEHDLLWEHIATNLKAWRRWKVQTALKSLARNVEGIMQGDLRLYGQRENSWLVGLSLYRGELIEVTVPESEEVPPQVWGLSRAGRQNMTLAQMLRILYGLPFGDEDLKNGLDACSGIKLPSSAMEHEPKGWPPKDQVDEYKAVLGVLKEQIKRDIDRKEFVKLTKRSLFRYASVATAWAPTISTALMGFAPLRLAFSSEDVGKTVVVERDKVVVDGIAWQPKWMSESSDGTKKMKLVSDTVVLDDGSEFINPDDRFVPVPDDDVGTCWQLRKHGLRQRVPGQGFGLTIYAFSHAIDQPLMSLSSAGVSVSISDDEQVYGQSMPGTVFVESGSSARVQIQQKKISRLAYPYGSHCVEAHNYKNLTSFNRCIQQCRDIALVDDPEIGKYCTNATVIDCPIDIYSGLGPHVALRQRFAKKQICKFPDSQGIVYRNEIAQEQSREFASPEYAFCPLPCEEIEYSIVRVENSRWPSTVVPEQTKAFLQY